MELNEEDIFSIAKAVKANCNIEEINFESNNLNKDNINIIMSAFAQCNSLVKVNLCIPNKPKIL